MIRKWGDQWPYVSSMMIASLSVALSAPAPIFSDTCFFHVAGVLSLVSATESFSRHDNSAEVWTVMSHCSKYRSMRNGFHLFLVSRSTKRYHT